MAQNGLWSVMLEDLVFENGKLDWSWIICKAGFEFVSSLFKERDGEDLHERTCAEERLHTDYAKS